jgi:hypothetical protein
MTMADAAEWEAYSERDDQDRLWDGPEEISEVRPEMAEDGAVLGRPADHVPQLHRALSEAAADLDLVEDRLSTLFERSDDPGPARRARSSSEPAVPAADSTSSSPVAGGRDDILDLFDDGDIEVEVDETDDDEAVGIVEPLADRMAVIGEYEDDIAEDFAALDAELAAEKPDDAEPVETKRRMFRRQAKRASSVRR